MDFDEQSLNSVPTMGPGGFRPPVADEPSIGSAPTMAPNGEVKIGNGELNGDPRLGQIDQYALVRKLGGGGFGVVYLARDTVSGVDVAIKTLHPLLKSNPEEMETLRAKFALVSRLSHPNMARALVLHPCRDIAIADDEVRRELRLAPGDFMMVMDYAPGVTLSKWRRQFPDGVVPLDLALEVIRQIASALDYAHGEKIVHRDIKPANVMVETLPAEASQPSQVESRKSESRKSSSASSQVDPTLVTRHSSLVTSRIRVRILDFGLAAEIRSSMSRVSNETGDTSGTRPYMAPEQWRGEMQDGRADQYALACVAYELLTGAPPFAGVFETGDPAIMANAIVTQKPQEPKGLPQSVSAGLIRALSKNPKDRFASCREFAEALERHGSSRRGLAWIAAGLVALVAVVIAVHPNGELTIQNGELGDGTSSSGQPQSAAAPPADDGSAIVAKGLLKTTATREVQKVEKPRKWNDGEFQTQLATNDSQKVVFDSLAVGSSYGPVEVTLERDGTNYIGTLARVSVGEDWRGERKSIVNLEQSQPPINIRGNFGSTRNSSMRKALLADGGGNAETEAAVLRSLRWLKAVQNPDGSWPNNTVAMTGFCILTFLAHGERPGESLEFGETVQRAIDFLIAEQNRTGGGLFTESGNGYAHAIATCAMCEAYGMTMNSRVREAADKGLEVIVNGQHPSGGWDYNWKQSVRDDNSVAGWCAQALKAGIMANFYHDPEALDRASRLCVQGFKKNGFPDGGFGYTRPTKGGLTGVGTFCLQLHHAADDLYVKNSLQNIIYNWKPVWIGFTPGRVTEGGKPAKPKDLPSGAVGGACPQYYYYYATQAVFQGGGEQWKKWNDCMWPSYVAAQFKIKKNEPGSKCICGQGLCDKLKEPYVDDKGQYQEIGHWVNTDAQGDHPIMDTCLAALQLMVYYRYPSTFKPVDTSVGDTMSRAADQNNKPQKKSALTDEEMIKWPEKRPNVGETTSSPQGDLRKYFSLIRKALYDVWEQPSREAAGDRPAKVTFRIDKSGRIKDPRLKTSSGSEVFDESVREAVRSVGAIPDLSDEFIKMSEGKDLFVEFKLSD